MKLFRNVQLADFTTYRIGGPANFFVPAKTTREVKEAVNWANKNNLPFFVLGGGSNVLISDNGYNGLILKIQGSNFKIQNERVEAEAGVDMQELVDATIKKGLCGLEWAGGLPGQLGGAIRGNAGAFGGEMKDIVKSVTALTPEGKIKKFPREKCGFKYRSSIFKENSGYIIIEAELRFKKGDPQELRAAADEKINWRNSRHPMEYGNSGSIFKRKHIKEVPFEVREKHRDIEKAIRDDQIATAYFIDEAGLKNVRVGGAEVSEKHPNFIVNKSGNATAEDVIMLKGIVKSQILNSFGVILEEEVEYLE